MTKHALNAKRNPSVSRWVDCMNAYVAAKQRYTETALAAQNDIELEDDADASLRDVVALERQLLLEPAPNKDALLIKLEIWRLERSDIDDGEWRALTADVERLA